MHFSEVFSSMPNEYQAPTPIAGARIALNVAVGLETIPRARSLNGDFVIVLFRAFSFRQEIPKLCRLAAIQSCLASAHEVNHANT